MHSQFFLSNLELTQDTTSKDVLEAYEGIINQTFNGDVDKIKRWQKK